MKVGTDDNVDLVRQGYKRLMCGILTQAYKDFHVSTNLETQLDALFWLASEDAKLFTTSLGMDYCPLAPCVGGHMRITNRIANLDRVT